MVLIDLRMKMLNRQGYSSNRVYIATQGPKPSTIEDFWLMCYEQDVKVIVALTLMEERGRVRASNINKTPLALVIYSDF